MKFTTIIRGYVEVEVTFDAKNEREAKQLIKSGDLDWDPNSEKMFSWEPLESDETEVDIQLRNLEEVQ